MAIADINALLGAFPHYALMTRSQYWPPQRLARHVEAQLARSLAAASRIPFYRERFGGGASEPRKFSDLPVLSRAQVPQLLESVRAMDPSRSKLVSARSAGSTGMPVEFVWDARHQSSRYAARVRYLRAHGWNPFARSAWIVSRRTGSTDAWFVTRSRFLGARFASHLDDFEQQAEWLRELDPPYLYAFPVNLEGLARVFESRRWRLASLRKIFSGSEILEDSLRERLRLIFGVEVSDNYGSTEAFLAWECPQGRYHVNAESVLLEVVDACGQVSAPGTMGRVLVTTLQNHLMPLIRYEIGDYAIAADGSCPCGRTLPLIGRILGREINLFIAGDGKRFVPWPLFRPLTAREWITQYQVVQRDVARFLIRFVSNRELGASDRTEITAHFRTMTRAPVTVEFERLERIARAPSGKFMLAMTEVAARIG